MAGIVAIGVMLDFFKIIIIIIIIIINIIIIIINNIIIILFRTHKQLQYITFTTHYNKF